MIIDDNCTGTKGGIMKILMAYSSVTGNTKKLCEGVYAGIEERYDIDICTVREVLSGGKYNFDDYEVIMVGFWTDKGTANKEARKLIKSLRSKKVILLGTLGAAPDSEHGCKVINETLRLIPDGNEHKAVYICRGKVAEKLIKRIKLLPLPKSIKDKMYESSINSRETNEEDIRKGVEFVLREISKF